jgi:hypothetical protein
MLLSFEVKLRYISLNYSMDRTYNPREVPSIVEMDLVMIENNSYWPSEVRTTHEPRY